MSLTTLGLYVLTVVIWGSTWIMMKFQLGEVAPAASLTYRYAAAGTLILCGALLAERGLLVLSAYAIGFSALALAEGRVEEVGERVVGGRLAARSTATARRCSGPTRIG